MAAYAKCMPQVLQVCKKKLFFYVFFRYYYAFLFCTGQCRTKQTTTEMAAYACATCTGTPQVDAGAQILKLQLCVVVKETY
jgi:hypothetical protein